MDDSFYHAASEEPTTPAGLASNVLEIILSAPSALLVTVILAPVLLILATSRLSERPSRKTYPENETSFWGFSYWFPRVDHGMSILRDPHGDRNNGIFNLDLGDMAYRNDESSIIQKPSTLFFDPTAWRVASKFFGLSAKPKYEKALEELSQQQHKYLTNQSSLHIILNSVIRNIQTNVPQMLTFVDNQIDLQPWEKSSSMVFISSDSTELNLFPLLRDMLGYACIPAIFGRGLLDKYPTLLWDLYAMDDGMAYFLMGLPAVTPWKGVFGAHMARRRVWEAVDAMQKALDGMPGEAGDDVDYEWGDLEDVSELIVERNRLWRDNGFTIKERGDINLLFALTINAPLLVYWHTLYILSTPSLLSTILAEITPHITITAPEKIGSFSTPPTLSISQDGLAKACPLFRSTYMEALQLSSPRRASEGKGAPALKDSDRFIPDRFLNHLQTETADLSAGFAERECLALVAGVLVMWEFEPAGGEGWRIPEMDRRTTGVRKPEGETRVVVRRRKFEWDD